MVRRRGYYEIQVMGKQLSCPHCERTIFSHREVYVELARFLEEQPAQQITLQSFCCKSCANIQQFKELTATTGTTITYKQVEKP